MTSKSGPFSVPPVSVIAGVQGALPPNRFSQGDIADAFLAMPGFAEHEDLVRFIAEFFNESTHACAEGPRLAGPRTGDDPHRSRRCVNGGTLIIIEFDICLRSH